MGVGCHRLDDNVRIACESGSERHKDQPAPWARLRLDIDDMSKNLCIACCKDVFTCIGVMTMSVTGETIDQLVGTKKRRKR